jgi:hypothetical protein
MFKPIQPMSRSQSRRTGAVLLAAAVAAGLMNAYEWRSTGSFWPVAMLITPIGLTLGPWWLVVGRPADPARGVVPRWIVWGEAAVALVGLGAGLLGIVWCWGFVGR